MRGRLDATAAGAARGLSIGEAIPVALWPDGGSGIGLGHWRRCLTLAEALRECSVTPLFQVGDPVLKDLCAQAGFAVVLVGRESDSLEAERLHPRFAACVVDSYRMTGGALARLRDRCGTLVWFDDLGDPPPADLIINGTPGADERGYALEGSATWLLGPRYFMLRPDLRAVLARPVRPGIEEVLLSVGGGDDHDLLPRLVLWVREALPGVAAIHCLVGPYADPSRLEGLNCSARGRVVIHRHPMDAAALLGRVDVAVTGGGQTACELAAVGVPAVGLRLGDDQRFNLRALTGAGTLIEVGMAAAPDLERRVIESLRSLRALEVRAAMADKGRALFDGLGARRVAEAILAAVWSQV